MLQLDNCIPAPIADYFEPMLYRLPKPFVMAILCT